MRHLKKGRKFHRKKGQRRALLKALINNLIVKEKIETTEAKAKELKSRVEKLVTLAKKNRLENLRLLLARLPKSAAKKLFYEIAPRYQNRSGGYVRIIESTKLRKKDGAKMAIIEFIK